MFSITVTNKTYSTWMSILGFAHECLQQEKKQHETWLVGYYDEYHNFHYENPQSPKNYDPHNKQKMTPVYVLSPWSKTTHVLSWRKQNLFFDFHLLGDNQLYRTPDNPLCFEPSVSIEMRCEKEKLMDDFLTEAYNHLLNVLKFKSTEEITVWVWHTDYWNKMSKSLMKRSLSTIYLPQKTIHMVCRDLENFLMPETREKYKLFGIPYHRTYCFHGLAGTGKTSLIHALASTYHKNIAFLPFDLKLDDSVLIDLVSNIPENCFLVLEDFDCLFQDNHHNEKKSLLSMSSFLNCLDGIPSLDGQIVFLTTNHYVKLDPVICRPGRIDQVVEFTEVTRDQLFSMLEKFFPQQKEKYDLFYEKIRNKQLTTCLLQQYLFQLYPDGCILQEVDTYFDERIKLHQISRDKKPTSLYM